MKILFHCSPIAIVAAFFVFPAHLSMAAGGKSGMANPDFTRGDAITAEAKHDWNLGPTGARGWIYTNRMETSEARQIYVTQVEKGSPAESVLEKGDVILGIANKPFSHDPRTELGKAIGKAEASDGALRLIRWREGKTDEAILRLKVLGAYSTTAPFDCTKSRRIFEQGCEVMVRNMKKNSKAENDITRCLNALALLASGREEYLPIVRAQVEKASKFTDPERRTLHSWFYGPSNMLVAEYTLATGDRSFVPDLERMSMEIVRGQSAVGSWGHRFVPEGNGGRLAGYGMINATGLPLTVSLILAREAGVKNPELDTAIAKSLRMIRFYVGKGSVPYGDHSPWIETHDDNGKNGIAAVMFNLIGDAEAATYFSRMSVASHGGERDMGHTGNFLNLLWAMPGVALSGSNASGAWMNEFGWYYDLARRWDGSFSHLGAPQAKPDSYKGWDTTGAYLLAYAQPFRKIHIAGKKTGVVKAVDKVAATGLINDGRGWSPRLKDVGYTARNDDEIFTGLASWSPVVRERSAHALAKRKGDPLRRLVEMLKNDNLFVRLGACQALAALGSRGASAVPALRNTLKAEDLWLRIKAAEALAAIGDAAMPAVPELLTMLAAGPTQTDPRGMQQRYLMFALFDQRSGLLKRSLVGVDREALYEAVRAGLRNEDGRARSAIETVYRQLSYEEIEPLLPAIHQAVVNPAPSGIMFADGIRLSGLGVLAKQRIAEGMPLCIDTIEIDRWGMDNRIKKCLETLQIYGGAAKPLLPRLEELETKLRTHRDAKKFQAHIGLLGKTIMVIRSDSNPPELRPLPRG